VAEKKMTNIRLDPELWARVKAAASERGTTLERWVSDALEAHMHSPRSGGASAPGAAWGQPGISLTAVPAPMTPAPGDEAGRLATGPTRHADTAASAEAQALHWRVEALEAAVDYLAGVVGGGFRRAGAHPGRRGRRRVPAPGRRRTRRRRRRREVSA
jgi:hypothetical protein